MEIYAVILNLAMKQIVEKYESSEQQNYIFMINIFEYLFIWASYRYCFTEL